MVILRFILGTLHTAPTAATPSYIPTNSAQAASFSTPWPALAISYLFHGGSSCGHEGPSLRLELSARCCVHTHLWCESLCAGALTRRPMAGHWAAARPHPSHSAGRPARTESLWDFLHESDRWVAQPCRVLPDGCFLDLPPLWSWRAPASHHPASCWHWPDPETYHSDDCTGNPRV